MKPTLLLSILLSFEFLSVTACTERQVAATSAPQEAPLLADDDDPAVPDDPNAPDADPDDVDPDFVAQQAPGLHHSDRPKLAPHEIVKLLADTGFPKHTIARLVCTAKFESHFDPGATNLNRNGTQDTGLFQINDIWLSPCGLTREALLDPAANAKCALRVWKQQGLRAWTAYKRKRRTCQRYRV